MMGDAGPLSDNRVPSTLLSQLSAEIRRAGSSDVVAWNMTRDIFKAPGFTPAGLRTNSPNHTDVNPPLSIRRELGAS